MHKLESAQENEKQKILWDFQIKTITKSRSEDNTEC